MSLFRRVTDEADLCNALKAYVEEFGPECVTVKCPRHWKEYSDTNLGRVKLEYTTDDLIVLLVQWNTTKLVYAVRIKG